MHSNIVYVQNNVYIFFYPFCLDETEYAWLQPIKSDDLIRPTFQV